jgi:CheY-like chemotaxis protein
MQQAERADRVVRPGTIHAPRSLAGERAGGRYVMRRHDDRQNHDVKPDSPREREPAPIVLAEDDEPLRTLVASILRAEGFDVLEAADGLELLQRLEDAADQRRPRHPPVSVVVTDVRMPGLSGLEILSILRCSDWKTPVILVTAFADENVRAEARELGAAAVLSKPVDLDELCATVRRVALAALRRLPGAPIRGPLPGGRGRD